ncbi:hypothetical protein Tco_0339534 [Tanacetum coccineum]
MITLSNTMVVLESCPKHNMVAYLEKTDGNAEFHDIIDFPYAQFPHINHASHCKSVVSTIFVEQFWKSAKFKNLINNVRHITTKASSGDEGAPSERPSEVQLIPSPTYTSEVPLVPQTNPSPTYSSEVPVESF